jgi:hypothetical protein
VKNALTLSRHSGLPPRERGQTMTEYLIILPSLLFLVLGAIQFALIYQAKFTLNYAAFMGARQGALKNAKLTSIKDGVASGLTPLFMRTASAPSMVDVLKARAIAYIEVFNPLTSKVEIISPSKAAFEALKDGSGQLPNDNLMYRVASGDGMSIQDANLLKIKVTYCVKLVVPFANRAIYTISQGIEVAKNLGGELFWSPKTTATTPNMCKDLSDLYATVEQRIDSIKSSMPAGVNNALDPIWGTVQSVLDSLPSSFPTIPVLNWNISGMRIPVTAEAIVRMQSPILSNSNLP